MDWIRKVNPVNIKNFQVVWEQKATSATTCFFVVSMKAYDRGGKHLL
jgi:hypothetical protein